MDFGDTADFPQETVGLNYVTENFTTFFTARKVICHQDFTLEAFSTNSYPNLSVFKRSQSQKWLRIHLMTVQSGMFISLRPFSAGKSQRSAQRERPVPVLSEEHIHGKRHHEHSAKWAQSSSRRREGAKDKDKGQRH